MTEGGGGGGGASCRVLFSWDHGHVLGDCLTGQPWTCSPKWICPGANP